MDVSALATMASACGSPNPPAFASCLMMACESNRSTVAAGGSHAVAGDAADARRDAAREHRFEG
jgi:hypothetical protein